MTDRAAYKREWRERNKELCRGYVLKCISKPGVRERRRAFQRAYDKKNAAKRRADWAARKARKMRAMPPWVDKALIERIYAEARSRGVGWHVDHIVPLNNDMVCGLHVPWNLRIIPRLENERKRNSYDQDAAVGYDPDTYRLLFTAAAAGAATACSGR